MKLANSFLIASLFGLVTACGPLDTEADYYAEDDYYAAGEEYPATAAGYDDNYRMVSQPASAPQARRGGDPGKVVMHPTKDPNTGVVSSYVPLPADWQVKPNGWFGPAGEQVVSQQGGSFLEQQRPVYSVDQIVEQDVLPKLRQQGYRALGTIDLPEVARRDQQLYAGYWKAAPSQDQHAARGVEYESAQGARGLIVVHFTLSRSQFGGMSFYYLHVMEAPAERYEAAKSTLRYALANYEIDRQYLAAYNQREQQKSQASWNDHNRRMATRQRSFDSWQSTQRTLSDVGDIYHEGWQRRSQLNDRGQERAVDGIWEREAVVDPYYGQTGRVEAGYQNYYMNQFGEYIGTDDQFYNPNMDPQLNNQEWRQVQRQGGGY
jgi:hypothetical protein